MLWSLIKLSEYEILVIHSGRNFWPNKNERERLRAIIEDWAMKNFQMTDLLRQANETTSNLMHVNDQLRQAIIDHWPEEAGEIFTNIELEGKKDGGCKKGGCAR